MTTTNGKDSVPRSRRALLASGLILGGALAAARWAPSALGQESTPAAGTIGTPAAGSSMIKPTGVGPVPSTGASRPGPVNLVRAPSLSAIIAPVGLTIERAGVDAGIERLRVVDGAMQDPSGPWEVAWYENLGSLGTIGNVVMAGHIDYWNVGPSVFFNLASVQPGDPIVVAGDDGEAYAYAVDWVQQFDSTSMPLDDVTGQTGEQSLTLITCGGAFDFVNGEYLQRTVVRAHRSFPAEETAAA